MRQEMQQGTYQEVISMEEYLCKRQEMKEKEEQKGRRRVKEKNPVLEWAELYR